MKLHWFRAISLAVGAVGVVLGSARPAAALVVPGRELVEVNDPWNGDLGPSISPNGLELHFSTHGRPPRTYSSGLWVATRESLDDSFGEPTFHAMNELPRGREESQPEISGDGLSLYFSAYQPDASLDIWMASRTSSTDPWQPPVNLGPTINTSAYEGRPSVSADGLILVFDSDHKKGGMTMSTRKTVDEPFGPRVDLGMVGAGPEISSDGLSLYFSKWRDEDPRPDGESDIFVARRASRSEPFGEPVTLGPRVNTRFAEALPDISADGSTLYITRGSFFLSAGMAPQSPSFLRSADLWEVPLKGPALPLTLTPDALVRVLDNDGSFDGFGDFAESALERERVGVGEGRDRLTRLVAKFSLPEPPTEFPRLQNATLRFLVEEAVGTPAGPVSVLHSLTDNDLDMAPSDYEDSSYADTGLDLARPGDELGGGRHYEIDVTDLVRQDYTEDRGTLLSAFRLQVNEATFVDDDLPNNFKFTMPQGKILQPQLVLTFVPEPSTSLLAVSGLIGLWGCSRPRRRS